MRICGCLKNCRQCFQRITGGLFFFKSLLIDLDNLNCSRYFLSAMRIAILISSLFCFMEWGGGNSTFLFQAEYLLFTEKMNTTSFSHPLILLPFAGQLLIISSYFFKRVSRKLALTGIIMLSTLVLVILISGLLSLNFKVIFSTLPFIGFSLFYILAGRRKRTV